jgi:hypothetical protein
MDYRELIAAASAQFEGEQRTIDQEQQELNAARWRLNRRRKALGRKRARFERVLRNFRELDNLLDTEQLVDDRPENTEAA